MGSPQYELDALTRSLHSSGVPSYQNLSGTNARSPRDASGVPVPPQQTHKLALHNFITLTYPRFQTRTVHNRDVALGIANPPRRLQAPGHERDTFAAYR